MQLRAELCSLQLVGLQLMCLQLVRLVGGLGLG